MAKLTDEERKRILAKIRKLLALKEGAEKIGSEGEAYAAANGVHRLLTEYNLSMADVMGEDGEKTGPEIKESDGISYASHFGLWKQNLMGVVCKYNYCTCVSSRVLKQVYIVGQEDNVAVCHQLFDYLVKAFVRLAKEKFHKFCERFLLIAPNVPLSVAKLRFGEKQTNEYFHSYYIGTVDGLKDNFEERLTYANSDEHALVVTFNKAIDDFLKEKNYSKRRGTVFHSHLNTIALNEGYDDGRNINLDRQIGGKEQQKINNNKSEIV